MHILCITTNVLAKGAVPFPSELSDSPFSSPSSSFISSLPGLPGFYSLPRLVLKSQTTHLPDQAERQVMRTSELTLGSRYTEPKLCPHQAQLWG